ncbi:MAG TPA: carboxyl transferase domain-containing protein, partial [Candidatus Baltobacteraceae bacterium]|nr:carboxyl transferase domain-containing protein [Candidatus Baltobacteraceae bacterium]
MAILETRLDRTSEAYRQNFERIARLVNELRTNLQAVRAGGGPEATEKHRKRGKLPARERIDRLIDPGAPFLEFGALAANGMYNDDCPSAGIITGIGVVEGQDCVIIANDAT